MVERSLQLEIETVRGLSMKRKTCVIVLAGLSAVVLPSYLNSDADIDNPSMFKVQDWFIVGSPPTHYPGQSSIGGGGGTATGTCSMAMGPAASASGPYTIAFGAGAESSNAGAMSMGFFTIADGVNSLALGDQATSYGQSSVALGLQTKSAGKGTIAIGSLNDIGQYDPQTSNPAQLHPDDHLFVVGNGQNSVASNALVTKWSGETHLKNKYWDSNNPTNDTTTDPHGGAGEALVVDGHTILNGKVVLGQRQGDILMGSYGQ